MFDIKFIWKFIPVKLFYSPESEINVQSAAKQFYK